MLEIYGSQIKSNHLEKYGWLLHAASFINTGVNHSSAAVCSLFKARLVRSVLEIAAITLLLALHG